MIILTNRDVVGILRGRDKDVLNAVRLAYVAHEAGDSAVPHSVFLRFPGDTTNRIIALPAYLGGVEPIAGIKWVASFPANVDSGLQRASAAIILNNLRTGQPRAMLEASVISARRTGASAALAAQLLGADTDDAGVTLLGCGVINFEVLRFLTGVRPALSTVVLYDRHPARAQLFRARCARQLPHLSVRIEPKLARALAQHTLLSIATTAAAPYLDTRLLPAGTLVLHVSLRDVLPAAVLEAVNVVDDVAHVFREETSLHLAERKVGHRGFVASTIGALAATAPPASPRRHAGRDRTRATIFSPFGLGILDLAVAALLMRSAEDEGRGIRVDDFLPGVDTDQLWRSDHA